MAGVAGRVKGQVGSGARPVIVRPRDGPGTQINAQGQGEPGAEVSDEGGTAGGMQAGRVGEGGGRLGQESALQVFFSRELVAGKEAGEVGGRGWPEAGGAWEPAPAGAVTRVSRGKATSTSMAPIRAGGRCRMGFLASWAVSGTPSTAT
ncbi:hypothetical protein B1218_32680, partial [Pseudomonas ogarae]